jgi:hypothetical protein
MAQPTDGWANSFGTPSPIPDLAYASRMSFHLFDDPREQTLRTVADR